MNKPIFEGEWNRVKGKIQESWAEITDDDLLKIKADWQQLYGMVEKKYGFTKEEAKERVNAFLEKLSYNTNNLMHEIDDLKKSSSEMINTFSEQVMDWRKKIPARLHEGQEKIEHSIENHLWPSVGIMVAVGFLIGFCLSHKK